MKSQNNNSTKKHIWILSTAGILSLCLIVASIILLFFSSPIVKVDWAESIVQFFNNIGIGLSTNLIGIIVTISAVQYFLDKQKMKNEKEEEYKKILRYNKYAQVLIQEYIAYFNLVVTPMEKRSGITDNKFVKTFELTDLCDLYTSSAFTKDMFYTPVIERFYDADEELHNYFLRMNEEIDFKYSETLEKVISDFLVNMRQLDVRRNIIGQQKLSAGGKKESICISEELKNPSRDYLKDFREGKLKSNLLTPIVCLYYYLQYQRETVLKYLSAIEGIENELQSL